MLSVMFDLADRDDSHQGGGTLATFVRATKESSRQRMYIEKLPRLDYH